VTIISHGNGKWSPISKAKMHMGLLKALSFHPPQTIPNPTPSDDSPATMANLAFLTWLQQDQMVLSTLVSTISESLISQVIGYSTSSEVWNALECMNSSQSRARIMQVHYQLATLKTGGSSVIEYFQKFKALDTLAAAGQPLNDFELVSFLLAGLGSEFDPFVTSVTTRVDPMSIEELYAHLLTHEMRLEHNSTAAEAVFPYANVATAHPFSPKNKGPYQGSSQSSGPSCGGSHNKGYNFHNRSPTTRGRFGRGRGSPSSHSSNSLPPRHVCQVCNKSGHTALTCYHRFDYSFQHENSPNMQAFTTLACPPTSDVNWYPDTGATNHVTADLANLNLHTDGYTGTDQLHVGNGQGLPISHTGTSK